MAHFAKIEKNGTISNVIVVSNDVIKDSDGIEREQKGIDFCRSLFGNDSSFIQTSYNGVFRKQFAGIGFSYDPIKDIFISPQSFPSWALDQHGDWTPPVQPPSDGRSYQWDEKLLSWTALNDGI